MPYDFSHTARISLEVRLGRAYPHSSEGLPHSPVLRQASWHWPSGAQKPLRHALPEEQAVPFTAEPPTGAQ